MTNTTLDVVNTKTDLHIHPSCTNKDCAANGIYQGDDGETLDTSQYLVIVNIAIEADVDAAKPTQFNLTFNQQASVGDVWKLCDNSGSLIIYNGERNKMN